MPLHVKYEDNLFKPVAVCDYCHQEITSGKQGNFQWREDDPQLYFTHKQCCHPFEQQNAYDGIWFADELEFLPVFLASNLKVDISKAKQQIKLIKQYL